MKQQMIVLLAAMSIAVVGKAQFNVSGSGSGSNLTTQPNWNKVGIGLDDPDIVRKLHVRGSVPGLPPNGNVAFTNYTSGIRIGGRSTEQTENGTITKDTDWDLATTFDAFHLYNVTDDLTYYTVVEGTGYTGIGTVSPQGRLDVHGGSSHFDALWVRASGAVGAQGGLIHHQSSDYAWQTVAQNTAYQNNSSLRFHFINRTSPEVKETSNVLVLHSLGRVGVGTISPACELDVAGTMRACEVLVNLNGGWCDYVFDENYELPELSSVERFIKEHHHLPEVPSEAEVLESGINVADMNAVLLKKVEELTLYVIDLKKENDKQQALIESLSVAPSEQGIHTK